MTYQLLASILILFYSLNITEVNKIFRRSIIKGFFESELVALDFKKSNISHPIISENGLMQSALLHIFFDIDTGSDYPDGDEWFIVEFLFPYEFKLPDSLKGTDFFTTVLSSDNKTHWHHRELVRYKYGKTKKLSESLEFLEAKYKELHTALEPFEKDIKD